MAYPAPPPHTGSAGSSGLDETELLAAVRGLAVDPGPWTRGSADGDPRPSPSAVPGGWLSEREYHGVRRGPFAVQRAALSLFAAWLERRCVACRTWPMWLRNVQLSSKPAVKHTRMVHRVLVAQDAVKHRENELRILHPSERTKRASAASCSDGATGLLEPLITAEVETHAAASAHGAEAGRACTDVHRGWR